MKSTRVLSAALIAAALVGCSQEEQLGQLQESKMQFSGSFEQVASRVALNDDYTMRWEDDDKVSIFPGLTVNNQYKVSNIASGRANFTFVNYVEPTDGYSQTDANYAIYPYANANSINANGIMTASVHPDGFTYDCMENSIKNALMAAKSNDGSLNFKNVQGILRLKLNAVQPFMYGAVKSIELASATQNLSGKVEIEFNDQDLPVATWVEGDKNLTINLSAENQKDLEALGSYSEFYLPMVPANFAANDVTLTINWDNRTQYNVVVPIDFNIERRKIYTLVHTLKGGIDFDGGLEEDGYENENYVATIAELQEALDNATGDAVINIAADITGDAVVTQKENVNITILGQGFKYNGVIIVDGRSATETTAGLTIKDLNFAAESISADACIRLGDGTNATRYTCNVTVENCTFDVPGAVGVKSYTGGDKNLIIKGCTATEKAHSLVQAKGIDGILVEKCTINSKNGMNFNNSTNVTVNECIANVKGYAARFGEGSAANENAEVYSIKNSALKSACEEAGDAVIILRGTANNATLTIVETTIEGTPGILNNATGAQVFIGGKVVATNSSELNAMIAGDANEIFLADGAVIEGTFTVKRAVTISSVNAENKATIKGRVNVSNTDDVVFNNIKFAINDASKHQNTFSGAPYKYPGIVVAYGAAMSFEGCEFETSISTGVCGINAGNHADDSDLLTVNNCSFKGDFYAIRTRTLCSITNSNFDIYTNQGTLAAVWTWGNANSGATKVTFTNNTNINANKVYSVQMTASNFVYDNININVQGNENFYPLTESVDLARFNGTHTFEAGSETF